MQSRRTKASAAFIGAVIIGGTNFIAVTFSNRELPPLFGAALRFAVAALIFFLLTRWRRLPLLHGRKLVGAGLYGLLGFGLAYAGLYYALQGLAAGTVSIVMAAAPLVTLLMAVIVGQERLTTSGLIGGLLTVIGIGLLSVGSLGGDLGISHLLGALLGVLAASASSVVARSYRQVHPEDMNAYGMAAGAALLIIGSLVLGETWLLPSQGSTWLALGWLILLGSVGLFQLFLYIVNRWTASAATFAISAMPVVAAGLGVLILNQPITVEVLVGGAMVIAAVYIGAIRGAGQGEGPDRAEDPPQPARVVAGGMLEPEA
jgi:drug/metabolite transporter (DMT)-like permease